AHAIRLGMRLVSGLREPEAQRIVAARLAPGFASVGEVAAHASLPKRATQALAICGAFRSLTEHRNTAFWNALGVTPPPGMLAKLAAIEAAVSLPAPTEWEEIRRDYQQLGFSTGRHPLALLRPGLRKMGISSRQQLNSLRSGQTVRVSGLVTHLQHP